MAPFVVGRRVLDLGAGEGYVASALGHGLDGVGKTRRPVPPLAPGALWICGCDVGPFNQTSGPYVIYDGERLPFPDDAFDTTLLLLTLHHCADPERVLDEALRVTRQRLIVTESVFRNRVDRFWLDLLDRRLNASRHGGAMNVPLAFRTCDAWAALLAARGLRLLRTDWLGPWWERLIHHPVLFVLDVASSLPMQTLRGESTYSPKAGITTKPAPR
ncbi:MAG: class I SAM-dependent methyltransferase [Candidatus Rokuibacteriota bacterium]